MFSLLLNAALAARKQDRFHSHVEFVENSPIAHQAYRDSMSMTVNHIIEGWSLDKVSVPEVEGC